jgi:sugar O-acyltransferase (sialic acid O-acetyltransferase NeuD family)
VIPLYVYGSGGHAREILELVRCLNDVHPEYEMIGWIDDHPSCVGTELKGVSIVDWATALRTMPAGAHVVVAIGAPAIRRRIALRLDAEGIPSPVLVHPRAWVGRDVTLGAGAQVAAGAMVSTDVTIGRHAIVNQGCTVAHDVALADYATLAPGVRLSGAVRVAEGADLGTGAVAIQGRSIGAWSIVGAGAVVVRDVPANVTTIGVPAKVVTERPAGWHEALSDTVSP